MKTSDTSARPVKPPHRGGRCGMVASVALTEPLGSQKRLACELWRGSSYFTISELTASATAQREGIDNCPPASAYHLLHVLIEQLLDPIREAWGAPILVSSGYRCKELNALVGGAKNSHHLLGCAADITAPSSSPNQRSMPKGANVKGEDSWHCRAFLPPLGGFEGGHWGGREGANRRLFNLIRQMQQEGKIKFTQLILEGDGRWIHISYVASDLRCQVMG